MGYKYSFVDNETYSAADVNEITKRLVTDGIEDPFTDGVPHNLNCFNLLNSNAATDGIVPESDKTLKVTKVSDKKVSIEEGTAFFKSGATITVDVNKVELSIVPDTVNYIYVEHNQDLNTIKPVSSITEPTGDCVMLAIVDENGNVEDKRYYAVGKLPRYVSGYDLPKSIDFLYSEPGVYEIDVQGKNYNYFIIKGVTSDLSPSGIESIGFWTPLIPNIYTYSVFGSKMISKVRDSMPIRVCNTNGLCGGSLSLSYEGNILTLTIERKNDYAIDGRLEIIAI
ncbi:MAG: hypothetical protein E7404_05765 [Ruminococcaceae bacterium]|nr:hypothetical protein [Oscillospiraceae bacterium]